MVVVEMRLSRGGLGCNIKAVFPRGAPFLLEGGGGGLWGVH